MLLVWFIRFCLRQVSPLDLAIAQDRRLTLELDIILVHTAARRRARRYFRSADTDGLQLPC